VKSKCLNVFLVCSVSLFLILGSVNILPITDVNAIIISTTVISVQPPRIGANLGDIFQVDVNITDVDYLYGYEFRLFYNVYVLTALDLEPTAVSTNGPGFFFTNATGQGWKVWKYEIRNDDPYGNGTGYVWLAVTRPLSVKTGLSGSGRLARITFSADYLGISPLTFDLHVLGDPIGSIEHGVSEGMVVVGSPPLASFTYLPANPLVGENVTFDASTSTGFDGSTPQGLIAYWDFGDGTNGTGIITTHAYSAQGTYTANLTVTDPINRTEFTTASFKVSSIGLRLTPDFGPAGTTVEISATGFRPLSQIVLSFDDMQLGEILANAGGNFTATITVPLSERGQHFIKAWYDNRTAFAEVSFKVVDVTPLNVNVDVGAIHFRGEIAEFYVGTTFNGKFVDADINNATLCYREGTQSFNLTASVEHITTGLYRIPFTIPANPTDAPTGTYVLVVEGHYATEFVNSAGASFKSFLLSETLTGWNNLLVNINGTVGTIKTDIGLIKVKLDDINTTLTGLITTSAGEILARIDSNVGEIYTKLDTINATLTGLIADNQGQILAKIDTAVGTLNASLDAIDAKLVSIDGRTAVINSTLGSVRIDIGAINAKIAGIQGNITTITTDIGTIQADISDIEARITAIDGNVATVQTAIQTINGTITAIKGNIATIQTDVGAIETTLEGWSGTVSSITTPDGTFKILTLTTSTLVGSPTLSDHVFVLAVSGDVGTKGTTNIVLPKQLLQSIGSSIDKVSVTINDQAAVFTYKEGPSAYVLQVTYTHSTVTIKVYLSGIPPTPLPLSTIIATVIAGMVAAGIILYMLKRRRPQTVPSEKATVTQ